METREARRHGWLHHEGRVVHDALQSLAVLGDVMWVVAVLREARNVSHASEDYSKIPFVMNLVPAVVFPRPRQDQADPRHAKVAQCH